MGSMAIRPCSFVPESWESPDRGPAFPTPVTVGLAISVLGRRGSPVSHPGGQAHPTPMQSRALEGSSPVDLTSGGKMAWSVLSDFHA